MDIGKSTVYRARFGEVITIASGGGGGHGEPYRRDPQDVRNDHLDGLLSQERARTVYGVELRDGEVDEAATDSLRASGGGTADSAAFDFGVARRDWEECFGVVAEHLANWLPSLPAPVRRHAQERVYALLRRHGPGPYDGVAAQGAIEEVRSELGDPASTRP